MSDADKPLVSVFCTAYNHEKYIRSALDGFLMQETDFPFEIIIHDDASTDKTADIIREYESKFKEKGNLCSFIPIYQTENQYSKKISISKTFIFPRARGKYFALCEGDDFWIDKHKLLKQVRYMEQHEDCPGIFHAVNVIVDEKVVRNDLRANVEVDFTADDVIVNGGDFISTPSLLYRREFAFQWPKFRQMANVGDYPFQILLALNGKVHYLPEIMGCYRYMSDGSWNKRILTDLEFLINHCFSEIKWMIQLNKDTNGKHQLAISYILFKNMRVLRNKNALQRDPFLYELFSKTERKLNESQNKIIGKIADVLSK